MVANLSALLQDSPGSVQYFTLYQKVTSTWNVTMYLKGGIIKLY